MGQVVPGTGAEVGKGTATPGLADKLRAIHCARQAHAIFVVIDAAQAERVDLWIQEWSGRGA